MLKTKQHNLQLEVAGVLYAKRKELRFTLKEVATAIGLTYQHYSKMEKGVQAIPVWVIGRVADIFGVEFVFSVRGSGVENETKIKFSIGDACKVSINKKTMTGIVFNISEQRKTFDINTNGHIVAEIPIHKFHRV